MGIPKKRGTPANVLSYALTCPEMVDTRDHLLFMESLATTSKNILEIGVDIGNTTSALLSGLEKGGLGGLLFSVDVREECRQIYDGHPQWTFINRASDQEILTKIFGTPEDDMGRFFDLIYIDGDHSYEGVKKDIDTAFKLIAPKGVILMHDVLALDPPNSFPGVRKAFDEIYVDGQLVTDKYIRHGSYGLGVILVA